MHQKSASPSLQPSFIPAAKESSRVMTQVASPSPHRGWHSRGYLPHWDHPGMIQSVNFRLTDALPQDVLERWKHELKVLHSATSTRASLRLEPPVGGVDAEPANHGADKDKEREVELRKRIEKYLDVGHGKCWLRVPEVASLVEGALLHFDKERYKLLGWCVMPNHVHVLIETMEGWPLGEVLHSWKSFTAKKANQLLNRQGEFWQREYLDRYVRNAEHYLKVLAYIEDNPVKAGMANVRTDWPWSSARFRQIPGSAGILPAIQS